MPEAKGSKKIHVNEFQILFTAKKITAYGGFSLLAAFFKKIGLPEFLEKAFPVRESSPNSLGAYPKILAFILMLFAGGSRS